MAWLFATLWGGGQYVSLYLTMRVYATIRDSHAPHVMTITGFSKKPFDSN